MKFVLIGLSLVLSVGAGANNLAHPRTDFELSFVREQNARTRTYLNDDLKLIEDLKTRAKELIPQNAPSKINFYSKNYQFIKGSLVELDTNGAPSRTIVDISTLPAGSAIVGFKISPDQQKMAFGYSVFGNDWQSWRIIQLDTLKVTDGPFEMKVGATEVNWDYDSKAIFYVGSLGVLDDVRAIRKPSVKYHKLGTPIEFDQIIFSNFEQLDSSMWSASSYNKDYILIQREQGVAEIPMAVFLIKRNLSFAENYLPVMPVNKYFGKFVGFFGEDLIFRTSELGSNYGLIKINPIKKTKKTLVSADPFSILYQARQVGNKILTQYLDKDLKIVFKVYDQDGTLLSQMRPSDYNLDDYSHPSLPLTVSDFTSSEAYFSINSINQPNVTFRLDATQAKFEMLPSLDINYGGNKIERSFVIYESLDGTKIPMSVFKRKDILTKPSFAYLFSYGFIGIPNLSQFNRKFQLMLDMGGVVALPHIRGGGEYGLDWQLAGTNKRWNTLNDLVFAGRWLRDNLQIEKIAVSGRSFGGMTTFAHYVHHQDEFDLFSAVVPVGDLVKFINNEVGWWAADDFGIDRSQNNGVVSPQDFENMYKQVKEWNPADHVYKMTSANKPLIAFSADNDNRVGTIQNVEFVNSLLVKFGENSPIYFMEHEKGGHGARAELIDEAVFIYKQFKLNYFKPVTK